MAEQGLDGALEVLRKHKAFGGFHHLLASARESMVLSVEVAHGRTSVEVVDGHYAHGNHIIHPDIAGMPQIITPSSRDRQRRADALLAEKGENSTQKIHDILCDMEPGKLPILRISPRGPEDTVTLAQAVFEVDAQGVIHVEVFDGKQQSMAAGRDTQLTAI